MSHSGDLSLGAAALLVILIAALVGGGLSGAQYYREQQRITQCTSTLKQISLSLPTYPTPNATQPVSTK